MKKQYQVTGMTCAACQANVTKAVCKLEGVQHVDVSLLSNSMKVEFDEQKVDEDQIVQAVTQVGYGVETKKEKEDGFASKWSVRKQKNLEEQQQARKRLILSVLLLVPLMLIAMGPMIGLPILAGYENAMVSSLSQLLIATVILIVQLHFFSHGFRSLFHKAPNMDTLVAIGSGASYVYALVRVYQMAYGFGQGNVEMVHEAMHSLYFESAAMIVTLVSVGKYLESRSKTKTTDALDKLMDLTPSTVSILVNGKEKVIATSELQVGDAVVIRPGDRIPVDGKIVSGHGVLDQSAITGESIPVDKETGDTVLSASLNQNGSFVFEALKVGEDSTLAKIIQLVDEAGNSKAPIARIADKVSGIFVPIVISLALIVFFVWMALGYELAFSLSNAISVLVISCPCALGLATPLAIMVSTGKAAQHGILIKDAQALESLASMDTIVLDKTGTITQGKPAVQDIWTEMNEEEFIRIAAGLEFGSGHPLAKAVVEYANEKGISFTGMSDHQAIGGKGVQAISNGNLYRAGNKKFIQEEGIRMEDVLNEKIQKYGEKGWTPLIFAKNDQIIGLIGVADAIKSSSKQAIKALKEEGLSIVMLTGDNQQTAKAIAENLLIDEVISDVLPTQKEAVISRLQKEGRKVVMVGDGINDAPALMKADVGIAIGDGMDIAIDSADVVLMKSSLIDVHTAIELSKKTIDNIRMNLFWAFFYNALGIPLAAGVFYPIFGWLLSPMIGSAAMSLSSVCVCANALRLRWFKPKIKQDVLEDKEKKKEEEKKMKTKTITVEGMMCMHCVAHVKKALESVEGVVEAKVDLDSKSATVVSENEIDTNALIQAVEEAGYNAK